jgi:hypothetical protein
MAMQILVVPAKAGIQCSRRAAERTALGPRGRGGDGSYWQFALLARGKI